MDFLGISQVLIHAVTHPFPLMHNLIMASEIHRIKNSIFDNDHAIIIVINH